MLAVLQDAIRCFQDYASAQRGRKRRLFVEAEQWIRESDSSWIFSFESICETLGLNPEYIRGGLRSWKQAKASADPSWSDREPGGGDRSVPARIAQSKEDAKGQPPERTGLA